MRPLSVAIGCAVVVACAVGAAGQQLASPSTVKPGTLAGAPQPRVSAPNQQLLRGTRANVLTTIQGNALSPTNGALPDAVVRLRDARYGHILDTQVTDKTGLFSFRALDPGTYVVELMGADQSVLAASQLLSVGAGDIASAVVKLPWRIPPLAGVLGYSKASAFAVTSAAAASGVLATAVTNPPISGEK
jgi:hypothetical protein